MYVVRGPMRDGGWAFHFRLRLMMYNEDVLPRSGSCTKYVCGSVTLSLTRVRWYAMICVGVGARSR